MFLYKLRGHFLARIVNVLMHTKGYIVQLIWSIQLKFAKKIHSRGVHSSCAITINFEEFSASFSIETGDFRLFSFHRSFFTLLAKHRKQICNLPLYYRANYLFLVKTSNKFWSKASTGTAGVYESEANYLVIRNSPQNFKLSNMCLPL